MLREFFYSFHGTFLSFHGTSQHPSPVTTQGNLQKIQSKLIPLTLNILFVILQSDCIHIPFYQHEHRYPNISVSRETKKILDVHFPEIFEIFQGYVQYISNDQHIKYFKLLNSFTYHRRNRYPRICIKLSLIHSGYNQSQTRLSPLFETRVAQFIW